MSQQAIIAVGDGAAVVLPPTILAAIGLHVGDLVEMTLDDGRLVLQPVEDPGRRQRVETMTDEILQRRQDAYRRLA